MASGSGGGPDLTRWLNKLTHKYLEAIRVAHLQCDDGMESVSMCVGFSEKTLTADQREKVTAFIASQGKDLLGLKLYPNLDCTSEDDVPSGMVAYFAPGAKVDPTAISNSLFQVFAVSKIETEGVTDDFVESKAKEIEGAIDQFPPKPISGKIINRKTGREVETWAPELGGAGSFAGVFSKLREDHRTKDYFIAARGTVPLYVQDLKSAISAKSPTWRELLYSEEWRKQMQFGVHVARRNVFRTLANVAEACTVEVMRMDDISSMLEDPNHAHPEQAVPEWEQTTHSVRATTHEGHPAVQVAYGVVPSEDCLLLQDKNFFVVSNPADHISMFKLSRHDRIQEAGAIPADTGRSATATPTPAKVSFPIHGVTWEGDAKTHPDLFDHVFKPVNAEFKSSMKVLGWNAEQHVEKLVPLAIKLYDPRLKRK